MQYEKYEVVFASNDLLEFEFISISPKGNIQMSIQFTRIGIENVYNLAFGNKEPSGNIDDISVNNNGDRDKILATVIDTVYFFTQKNPESFVFFKGSTSERTRLYRIAITIYKEFLLTDYEIYGIIQDEDNWRLEDFKPEHTYNAFLIKRKKTYI